MASTMFLIRTATRRRGGAASACGRSKREHRSCGDVFVHVLSVRSVHGLGHAGVAVGGRQGEPGQQVVVAAAHRLVPVRRKAFGSLCGPVASA
jgi:hypothetical protein